MLLLAVVFAAVVADVAAGSVQAANAQLSSREGRLSPQLMARLVQHLLLKHPTALKQGWVLEGWPRSLSVALLATFVSAGGSGGSNGSSPGGPEAAGKAGGRRDSTGGVGAKVRQRLLFPEPTSSSAASCTCSVRLRAGDAQLCMLFSRAWLGGVLTQFQHTAPNWLLNRLLGTVTGWLCCPRG